MKVEKGPPGLILHWMGIEKLAQDQLEASKRKLDEGYGADLSFRSLGPGKSWNIPQMKMAARVLNPSLLKAERDDLYRWWSDYFRLQLGLADVHEGQPGLLGFFDGNEPFSPTYTPWRWGAVAGVRFAAQRDGRQGIVTLCDQWFDIAAFMAREMKAADSDDERQVNRRGQLFDTADHVSPVGERGASGHDITDTRLLLAHFDRQPGFFTKREDWPYRAFIACGATRGASLCEIAKIRWWSEQHVLHFPSGRLVYKPRRRNWNTPCYFFDWFDYEKKTAVLGHPWPEGRAFRAQGEGSCWIEPDGGGYAVVAKTGYGLARCSLPHPLNEPILSHVVFGPDGFKKLV